MLLWDYHFQLVNIFKEINNEYPNKYNFTHGDLSKWFYDENIFLLNCSLTVTVGKPLSHMYIWKQFTENLIKYLAKRKKIIFLLLGNFAKQYKIFLNNNIVIDAPHPSPLSAHNGFFNSNIFRNINNKLIKLEKEPINWQN